MSRNSQELKVAVTYNIDTMNDAIRKSDNKFVQKCLKAGVSPNKLGKNLYDQITPLFLAINLGNEEIVKILLTGKTDSSGKADPLATNSDGNTALHHAVHGSGNNCVPTILNFVYQNSDTVQKLVTKKNNRNLTAFEYGLDTAMGRDESLALLAKYETQITEGKLKKIVQYGYLETLKVICDKFENIDLDELLLVAALKHRYKIIDFLISKGANINYQDTEGNSALHFSVAVGHSIAEWWDNVNKPVAPLSEFIVVEEIILTIKALINHKADINIKDAKGKSPLHRACDYMFKYEKVVNFFQSDNGFQQVQFIKGIPLVKKPCVEVIILLIQNKADILLENNLKETPAAIIQKHMKTVQPSLRKNHPAAVETLRQLRSLLVSCLTKQQQLSSAIPVTFNPKTDIPNLESSDEDGEEEEIDEAIFPAESKNHLPALIDKFSKKPFVPANNLAKSMQNLLNSPSDKKSAQKVTEAYYKYKFFLRIQYNDKKINENSYKEEKQDLDQIKTALDWKKSP